MDEVMPSAFQLVIPKQLGKLIEVIKTISLPIYVQVKTINAGYTNMFNLFVLKL